MLADRSMTDPDGAEALVAALVAEVLDSYEKLDVVIALVAAPRTREALGLAIARDAASLTEAIDELVAAGVIARAGGRLAIVPDGPWARHCVAAAELDLTDRAKVVGLMSQAALRRLRVRARDLLHPHHPGGSSDD